MAELQSEDAVQVIYVEHQSRGRPRVITFAEYRQFALELAALGPPDTIHVGTPRAVRESEDCACCIALSTCV